jgi:hypothetical protein
LTEVAGEDAVRAFRSFCERVTEADANVSLGRAVLLFEDLCVFAGAHGSWADEGNEAMRGAGEDLWTPAGDSARLKNHELGRRLDATIRAGIVFADLVNSLFLGEVFGRATEMHLTVLHRVCPDEVLAWFASLDSDALTAAYALRVYRNGLLEHFGPSDMEGASAKIFDLHTRRIQPIRSGSVEERRGELMALLPLYQDHPRVARLQPGDDGRYYYWDVLEALFYSIPPLPEDAANRRIINALTDHGRIPSPTMAELVATTLGFTRTVSSNLPAPTWSA